VHQKRHKKRAGEAGGKARFLGWRHGLEDFVILLREIEISEF
jgi:hypothetical protein